MKERFRCRCEICSLEKALLDELCEERHVQSYRQLAFQSSILSAFPSIQHLLQDLGELATIRLCDQVIGELLGLGMNQNQETAHQIILLILMPAMHKTAREIATGFRSLASEEIAQHVVTTMLEIIESKTLLSQQSHFAFRIARLMRRRSFCWALRESKRPISGGDLEFPAAEAGCDRGADFEPGVFLREFLDGCLHNGWLTPDELRLLILFKVEGVRAEVLAEHAGISELAFRHRMQRLMERLRRTAKWPSPIVRRKGACTVVDTMIETMVRRATAA